MDKTLNKSTRTLALMAASALMFVASAQWGIASENANNSIKTNDMVLCQMQDHGPRGGGPRQPGGPMLVLHPDVVKEIKLTDAQINALRAFFEANRPEGPPKEGDGKNLMDGVKNILSEEQFVRFRQIELQAMGPMGVIRPDVAQKLQLTQAQVDAVKQILDNNRPERGGGSPEHMKAVMDKVIAVLNADQREQYKAMLGKPFKLSPPPRDGGPGGHGGPGGGPGGPGEF